MWRLLLPLGLIVLATTGPAIDHASARPKFTVAECQDVYANCLTWCIQHNKTEASRIQCATRCKENYLSCRQQSDSPLPPEAAGRSDQVEPGQPGPLQQDPNAVTPNGGTMGQ